MDRESSRQFVSTLERSHGQALRRYLASRMRSAPADVPDLVQEVFLRMLRIPNYESIRNPQAYLYTIASHVLHQYRLRQLAMTESLEPVELSPEIPATIEFDPAETVLVEQRFESIGEALEKHSPRAYVALVMYRRDGATLDQIGDRLGVSDRMAKKYLIKALTFIQQALDEAE